MSKVMIVPSSTTSRIFHVADVTAVAMAVFSLPNGRFNRDETLPSPCRKQHMESIGA
jgi:hypothetical protein